LSTRHGNLQKYYNPNPIQLWLIDRFLRCAGEMVRGLDVGAVLDVGCAEGFVIRHLEQEEGLHIHSTGVDIDYAALLRGRSISPRMCRALGDICRLPFSDEWFDLVICTEVLEHLPNPQKGLRELRRVTRRYCLLSVPHEPLFRMLNLLRAKHIQHWGNDPEHLQNWTPSQFCRFAESEFKIVAMRRSLPWTVLLVEKC
jgi:SAM-dependent methyltransferase